MSIADEYEPLEVIGKGSFGTVRKVRQKDNGSVLVRKEIEYTQMNLQEKNHIISELRILRELTHPHIVKYLRHDHVPERKAIHIYQEYCDGGDLAKVIATFKRNKEAVPEEFVWEVLVQTLLALYRCHYGVNAPRTNLFTGSGASGEPAVDLETVIIHRDIKPDNIFLHGKTIKLGDFGLAKMLTLQNDFAKTYVGTPYYMSPEVLMDNPYLPVCDIWSLGCVLFELCNLQPPFQAKTHLQLQTRIKQGVIPAVLAGYSQQLRNIISDSITVDPAARPTCYDLLETLLVKMFRKEMELKQVGNTLADFQKQLVIKNDELKKRETALKLLERAVHAQKAELSQQAAAQRQRLEDDYVALQKKCVLHKQQLEAELMEDFELRKRAMDQEAKEMRLNYQREFKHVVEQEVQLRVSDYLKRGYDDHELSRKGLDLSLLLGKGRTQHKPRGPKEFVEDQDVQLQLQHTAAAGQQRRAPLKTRNEWEAADKAPTRPHYRKRITDEFERLNLQRRNIPEFEEQFLRQRQPPY